MTLGASQRFYSGGSGEPQASSHAQRSGLLVRELSLDTMECATSETLEGGGRDAFAK